MELSPLAIPTTLEEFDILRQREAIMNRIRRELRNLALNQQRHADADRAEDSEHKHSDKPCHESELCDPL